MGFVAKKKGAARPESCYRAPFPKGSIDYATNFSKYLMVRTIWEV